MKTLVLLLCAAALAAVALYFSFSMPAELPPPPQLPTTESGAQSPSALQPAAPAQLVPAAAEEPKPEEAAASQREARGRDLRATLPAEKLCTLAVSVSLPAGAPRDDDAEILVVGKLAEDASLDRELALLEPGAPLPTWLLARERFSADAPLEIALERRPMQVSVELRGRYSFAEPAEDVDISGEHAAATLHASLGACVRGRLVPPGDATERERDLRGSKLHLNTDPLASAGLKTSSDESSSVDRDSAALDGGAFEFRGVRAAKALTLTGTPSHLAGFKTTIDELHAGQTFEVTVPLGRGATVAGRVLDETGAAVAGAKIKARTDAVMFGFGARLLREGESDAQGRFSLEAVAAGKVMLNVAKEGYLDATENLEVGEGARIEDFVLHLASGARIGGRVHWKDGSPCAGAKVNVTFDEASMLGAGALNARFGAKGSGKSDEQGAFTVGGLGKGPFTVKATATPADAAPGEGSEAVVWTATKSPVKPGKLDVELTLEPPGDVSGSVVDDLGAAVTKCSVEVAGKSRSPFIPSSRRRATEVDDPEGRFSIKGLEAGAYTVKAELASGASSNPMSLELPLAAGSAPIQLILPRPATVSGRVLLPDGSPAARAHVQRQLSMFDIMGGQAPGGGPSCVTDDEGAFKLDSLPMGSIVLQALKDGYAASEGVGIKLAPAQQIGDVTLTLRLGGTIAGEVYDDHGAVKAGARILSQMQDLKYGQLWASSDAAGKFEFQHVPPGQWQVMSFGDALGASSGSSGDESEATNDFVKHMKIAMAAVKEGEIAHVVLGAPPKNPVHVRVRLTSAEAPVSGAMVSFIPSQEEKPGGALSSLKLSSSDKDGRLELDLDHSGKYLVTVQKMTNRGGQQSIEFPRDIAEAPDVSLELELPLGSISGRVVDSAGEPVSGARISLNPDGPLRAGTLTGGRFSELTTDERGEYLLDWLTPGRYSVGAGGMSFAGFQAAQSPLGRQVRDGIEVAEGQRVGSVDFKLRNACVLEGKVLDTAGKPVGEAGIFVRDQEGRPIDRIVLTSSNSDGEFVQKGLGPGRYTISARSAGLVTSEEITVELREDEPAHVVLHVGDGTVLIVTLTGADGAEVDASFSVVDEKGRQVNGTVSIADLMRVMNEGGFDTKHQRIGPLPPGKYTIEASTSDGAKTSKSVNLAGQSEKKITLKLGG